MVPAQCYERTVQVKLPNGQGSGFTITRHGTQWLITARHVVAGVDVSDISVLYHGVPVSVQLKAVPEADSGADVAAFQLDHDITADLTVHATSDGAVFTQDAYFLGFPYSLGMRTSGVTQLAFVKKAIISAFDRDVNGLTLWYLDGINNPGFSGGPVVFCRTGTTEWHVAAVVSGYRTEQVSIAGGAGLVPMNTGIIVAYDIKHGVDAIDAFVT